MPHQVAVADIILDFELGLLNDAKPGDARKGSLPRVARIPGYDWRAQVLAADGEDVLGRLIRQHSAGATLFKTKGFYRGVGAPGYVVRLFGRAAQDTGLQDYLLDEKTLFARAECLAHKIRLVFGQYDVWVIKTYVDGHRELWLASENEKGAKKCARLQRFRSRRVTSPRAARGEPELAEPDAA